MSETVITRMIMGEFLKPGVPLFYWRHLLFEQPNT